MRSKADSKIINLEKRGNTFVPVSIERIPVTKSEVDSNIDRQARKEKRAVSRSQKNPVEKILGDIVTDFFKVIRREMFR